MELSGVIGNSSLYLDLVQGPNSNLDSRMLHLWPEVIPGYFRAGEFTIHDGIDYLFSNEKRLVSPPVSGNFVFSNEIPSNGSTILAGYSECISTSGNINLINTATTGWVQLDPSWKELVFACNRLKLRNKVVSWTLLESSSTYSIYSYTLPNETEGFGKVYLPLPLKVTDIYEEWRYLGNKTDLISYGQNGNKEWALGSSGNILLKRNINDSPSTDLLVSYLASQPSFKFEEKAVVSSSGVALSIPVTGVSNVSLQLKNSYSSTGTTVIPFSKFPVYVSGLGILPNTELIVRYEANGLLGVSEGSSGLVVAAAVPSQSIVCVRYENGFPDSKFSGGRNTKGNSISISPFTTYPGFFIAVNPNHPLHSVNITGSVVGSAIRHAKILAWCSPNRLHMKMSPGKVKVMVIGTESIPISNALVEISTTGPISSSVTGVVTDINGEAFFEVSPTVLANSVGNIELKITNGNILVDILNLGVTVLNSNTVTNEFLMGKVHLELNTKSFSGFSSRKELLVWRTQADGLPCKYSKHQLNLTAQTGKLFVPTNSNAISISGNGSKSLIVQLNNANDPNWWDYPLKLEYEATIPATRDIISAEWKSPDNKVSAYGSLEI